MNTTDDRPAYLALAEQITGPVSVDDLATAQDALEAETKRHEDVDRELRDRRNALLVRLLRQGHRPADLVRPTGLSSTQMGRIERGEVSGRRAARADADS
jgi:hypothetical protein